MMTSGIKTSSRVINHAPMYKRMIDYKNEYYEKIKPQYAQFNDNLPKFWEMTYTDRWSEILLQLPPQKFVDIDVLDIGCGMGRAAIYFKQFGAKVLGVEPSTTAAAVARANDIKVLNDYFENVKIDQQFDVIHCEQVLSHVPDDVGLLEKAHSLLLDDGVIVIEEPNDNNPLQKLLMDRKGNYWVTPDHVHYYNYEKMEKLLNQTGFQVVKKSCTYPMELYELSGRHYIGDNEAGMKLHAEKFAMLNALGYDLRDQLYDNFVRLGWGRDLIFYAKKRVGDSNA